MNWGRHRLHLALAGCGFGGRIEIRVGGARDGSPDPFAPPF